MDPKPKIKRRGFVMTGGGAKGLYEAGVINAFHLTGMEFDIITGSSIGAMNSIFFAEYLFRKKNLSADILKDPEKTIDEMEDLIRCYHHTWLQMPGERLIDDSDDGSLGKLVKDLERFNVRLSDLVTLGWWVTDPQKGILPPPNAGFAVARIIGKLMQLLGGGHRLEGIRQLLRILKEKRGAKAILHEVLRTYLGTLDMEHSIIPSARDGKPGEDTKIENMFTRTVSPLKPEQLINPIMKQVGDSDTGNSLIDPERTLKEYSEKGIDVRLTRANYRTGRLEISVYLSNENFLRYMKKQAWRLDLSDPEIMPLGSFRLQLPGNPKAIKSALASGRFPGVFAPFPFTQIYPKEDPENELLYKLLAKENELAFSDIQDSLKGASFTGRGTIADSDEWASLLKRWQGSQSIRDFFPYTTDTYVDGGAIDNTPTNSAVDATREWIETEGQSKRDVILEMYIVFLEKEPRIPEDQARDPLFYEVVQRTLAIQSAAVKTSDAVVVETINKFGERSEELARSLLAVLDGLEKSKDKINADQLSELEIIISELAPKKAIAARGKSKGSTLEKMRVWAEEMLSEKLPLHVEEVKIYPDKMSLSTLEFTERLGYRQNDAVEMITMGCYNTLWTIRNRLKDLGPEERDAQDEKSHLLVNKWMEADNRPEKDWLCKRDDCIFHKDHCLHGAKLQMKQ